MERSRPLNKKYFHQIKHSNDTKQEELIQLLES